MQLIVANRFRLDYKIGHGNYISVYHGTDLTNGREVALKLCHFQSQTLDYLINEAGIFAAIGKGRAVGIPTEYWSGLECEYHVIAQELLGVTLLDLLSHYGPFSLKTILLIADQSIQRLEFMHSKGYLHCDIKPTNMAIGLEEQQNVLYLFDFGISKTIEQKGKWPCTKLYASPNIIGGKDPSWADDLESLGYTLLQLHGKITWIVKCDNKDGMSHILCRPSARCRLKPPSVNDMCKDLPEEFLEYFNHIRSLAHGQKPDYDHLRELFRRTMRNNGYEYDNGYDWNLKLRDEVHRIKSTPEEKPKPAEETSTGAKSG